MIAPFTGTQDAPLFAWQSQKRIADLQSQRERLMAKIATLPRHAHKRIELELRLRDMTHEQLALSANIARKEPSS